YYIPPHLIDYHPDTDQYGMVGTDIRFEDDELLHPMMPDIKNEIWGKSKIDKIAGDITGDILAWKFNREYFHAGGMHPRNVISFEKEGLTEDDLDVEDKRMKASSKGNERGTLFTFGKFQDISLSNKDMEFGSLTDRVRDRILSGYGVPPQKVGIIESGNLGSGSGDSQARDFKKKLKGIISLFEDEFRKVSDNSLGWDEHFTYGTLDLDDATVQTNIDNTKLNNGSVTINEIRKRDGLQPVDWGDVPYKVGNNSIQLIHDTGTQTQEKSFRSLSQLHTTQELLNSTNKMYSKVTAALEEH
ncbi:MAG: phage portal protein, partial [Methanobacterium paludis]|nr:phage portal protein [Methanobacterium paludis]